MSPTNDEQLYLEATQEVDSGTQKPALWAKAMALAEGDEKKAKYRYIALRVEQKSSTSEKIAPAEPPTSPTPETAEDLIPEDEIVHAGDAGPLESESELASRHAAHIRYALEQRRCLTPHGSSRHATFDN